MNLRRLILVCLVACGSPQRPLHRVPAPAEVGQLVVDDAAFARFAAAVRADSTTAPFVLAMLDALDGDWARAVARLDALNGGRLLGMSIRIWADARAHGGATPVAFRDALERWVAALPVDDPQVRAALSELRAMGQVFTPAVCKQLVDENVRRAADGTLGPDEIHTVVFQRYAAVHLAPVGHVIDEVLGAHGIAVPAP